MAKTKISVTVDPATLAQARALVGALDRLIADELDRRHVAGYLERPPGEEENSLASLARDPAGVADDVDWAALYGVQRTA
jgi:hypothetical protein